MARPNNAVPIAMIAPTSPHVRPPPGFPYAIFFANCQQFLKLNVLTSLDLYFERKVPGMPGKYIVTSGPSSSRLSILAQSPGSSTAKVKSQGGNPRPTRPSVNVHGLLYAPRNAQAAVQGMETPTCQPEQVPNARSSWKSRQCPCWPAAPPAGQRAVCKTPSCDLPDGLQSQRCGLHHVWVEHVTHGHPGRAGPSHLGS